MHWDAYTAFSVISGVLLIVLAALPAETTKNRLASVIAGAAFIAYGIYVAKQSSGTYVFPVYIFLVPIAALGKVVARLRRAAEK